MKIHLATLFLTDFNFYTIVEGRRSCCLCVQPKRRFHLRRYNMSVRYIWPCQATAAVSGTFPTDRRFSEVSEVTSVSGQGSSGPRSAGGAECSPLPFVICWGGIKKGKKNAFNSNTGQGTAGVPSGRDTGPGPGHADGGHRARPGSASALTVPTAPRDVAGPCALLFLSLPWHVLLAQWRALLLSQRRANTVR